MHIHYHVHCTQHNGILTPTLDPLESLRVKYDTGRISLSDNQSLCLRWCIHQMWMSLMQLQNHTKLICFPTDYKHCSHIQLLRVCVWEREREFVCQLNQLINWLQQCVREGRTVAVSRWRWCRFVRDETHMRMCSCLCVSQSTHLTAV